MQETFNGVRTIYNDDGSTTHITYEHEPPYEPLSTKEKLTLSATLIGVTVVPIALPLLLEKWVDRASTRREHAKRQKLNKEIYNSLPA